MNQLFLQAAAAMSPADIEVLHQQLAGGRDNATGVPSASPTRRRRSRITSAEQPAADNDASPVAVSVQTAEPASTPAQPQPTASSTQSGPVVSPSTSPDQPSVTAVSADDEAVRHRQHPSHDWPQIGAKLTADYYGEIYRATVIPARKKLMSGRQLKIENGPAAGEVLDSLSAAMIVATEEQRRKQNLRRKGVANGWDFWQWDGK